MKAVHAKRRPHVPEVGERAWAVFWGVDKRRQSNGYGANAISPSDLRAWCQMAGVNLRPWELEALDRMEVVRLNWLNRDKEAEPEVSDTPMTPALFRRLFIH